MLLNRNDNPKPNLSKAAFASILITSLATSVLLARVKPIFTVEETPSAIVAPAEQSQEAQARQRPAEAEIHVLERQMPKLEAPPAPPEAPSSMPKQPQPPAPPQPPRVP